MDIFNILDPSCARAGTSVKDKRGLLEEIATLAKNNPVLENVDRETILGALTRREEVGSTGFEKGLAIPHCRLPEIDDFVVGLVTAPDGVEFDSLDGQPAKIIFFIIAPESHRSEHIRLLSTISRTVSIEGATDELLAQNSSERLVEAFLRHVPDQLPRDKAERSLFQVFVQKEEVFQDILQVVASLATDTVVIEASDCSSHLYQLPLFSTFWNSDDKGFSRVVCGVIAKKLCNELTRGIDSVVGGLDDNPGAMVVILDSPFVAGSLSS